MENKSKWLSFLLKTVSYILVAAIASFATLIILQSSIRSGSSKLEELETILLNCFIGEADQKAIEDAGAAAMVEALGDRWSYYIPADQYDAYLDSVRNSYVGIGVTVRAREDKMGIDIESVDAGGGADNAGLKVGDIILSAEGHFGCFHVSAIVNTFAVNVGVRVSF